LSYIFSYKYAAKNFFRWGVDFFKNLVYHLEKRNMKKLEHAALRVSGNQEELDRFLRTEIINLNTYKGDFSVMLTVMGLLPEVDNEMNYKRKCFFIEGYRDSIVGKIHKQVIQYDSELINRISITGQCYEIDTFEICENSIEVIENDNSQILIAFEFGFSNLWLDLLGVEYPTIAINRELIMLDREIYGRKRQVIYNYGRIDDEFEYPDEVEIDTF